MLDIVKRNKISLRRIFSSYSFSLLKSYAGLQLISQINSLVSLFFIAKYLGPANLGIIAYAQYLAGLTVFINSGIDTWSVYEMMRNKDDKSMIERIFLRVSKSKILISIIALLIIIPLTIIKSDNNFELIMYICAILLSSISVTFFTQFNSYALANRLLPSVNRGAIFVSILILLTRVSAVYYEAPAVLFLAIILLEPIFIFTLFILNNSKRLLTELDLINNIAKLNLFTNIKSHIIEALYIIYEAKYFLGIYIFSLLASRADILMLKFYVDNHDLGIYSAAMRLAEYPVLVSGIIGNILVIHLALSVKSKIRYISIILGYVASFTAALIFIIVFNLAGVSITNIIYGSKFEGVGSILAIYSYGLMGILINNFSALIFMTHKKEYYLLYSNIIGASVLYILCKMYIPEYGIYGAAISSTVSYTIVGIFSLLVAYIIERKHKKDNEAIII